MKVLFLGSHSDDIELGCAATIHKHKDWEIYCSVLCTKGYNQHSKLEIIKSIARESLESLGVKRIYLEDFDPDNFYQSRQKIWDYLFRLKKEINPDIVITQIADEHQDHVTLNQESIRVFRDRNLFAYLSSYRSKMFFEPNIFEIVNIENVNAKLNCIKIYQKFYPNKIYLEDESVVALLRANGIYINSKFAEVFQTIVKIGIS